MEGSVLAHQGVIAKGCPLGYPELWGLQDFLHPKGDRAGRWPDCHQYNEHCVLIIFLPSSRSSVLHVPCWFIGIRASSCPGSWEQSHFSQNCERMPDRAAAGREGLFGFLV